MACIKRFTNLNGFLGMFCTQKSPDSIDDVSKSIDTL